MGPDEVEHEAPDFWDGQGDEVTVRPGAEPPFERVMVRKAWASMDSVMCRYQPVYWRTW